MVSSIDILIPAHNQLDVCRDCISSLSDQTGGPYRLILVDNASADALASYFDSIADAEVIHLPTNRGFAGAVNAGLQRAQSHVLILNSDTIVPKGALAGLVRVLESAPDWGMIGPRSNSAPGLQQLDGLHFASAQDIEDFAARRAMEWEGHVTEAYRITGFCMLVRDRVVKDVGVFDESYRIGTYEDFDYCIRVLQAGYRIGIAQDVFVFHHGSRTFQGMGFVGKQFDSLLAENEQRFFSKWGQTALQLSEGACISSTLVADSRSAFEQGRSMDAMRHLARAIEAFPYSAAAFNDFGVLLWNQGQCEKAYEYFGRAVKLNPGYETAVENFMDSAAELGHLTEARAAYDRWRDAPNEWRLRR